MGNSNSTRNSGIIVPRPHGHHHQQHQHQQQQQQQQRQQQRHSSPPSQGGGGGFHRQEQGDDPEYSRLRELANKEAEARGKCFEASQQAYKSGEKAKAKELSNKGREHERSMKQYNQQAADHIFSVKNLGLPPDEIDLHGLFVQEALEKADEVIARCIREKRDHLTIIVGKGNHSVNRIAKLKPAIEQLVDKYELRCSPGRNPGCIYVEFGKGKGSLDWLDQIVKTVGGCLIS